MSWINDPIHKVYYRCDSPISYADSVYYRGCHSTLKQFWNIWISIASLLWNNLILLVTHLSSLSFKLKNQNGCISLLLRWDVPFPVLLVWNLACHILTFVIVEEKNIFPGLCTFDTCWSHFSTLMPLLDGLHDQELCYSSSALSMTAIFPLQLF